MIKMCQLCSTVYTTINCAVQMVARLILTTLFLIEDLIRLVLFTIHTYISTCFKCFSLTPVFVAYCCTRQLYCSNACSTSCYPRYCSSCNGTIVIISILLLFITLFYIFDFGNVLSFDTKLMYNMIKTNKISERVSRSFKTRSLLVDTIGSYATSAPDREEINLDPDELDRNLTLVYNINGEENLGDDLYVEKIEENMSMSINTNTEETSKGIANEFEQQNNIRYLTENNNTLDLYDEEINLGTAQIDANLTLEFNIKNKDKISEDFYVYKIEESITNNTNLEETTINGITIEYMEENDVGNVTAEVSLQENISTTNSEVVNLGTDKIDKNLTLEYNITDEERLDEILYEEKLLENTENRTKYVEETNNGIIVDFKKQNYVRKLTDDVTSNENISTTKMWASVEDILITDLPVTLKDFFVIDNNHPELYLND